MDPAARQHEHIKMRLRLAGSSLANIARELAVAPTTVTIVSKGARCSHRIEAAIAAKLGECPSALWPERYRPRCNTGAGPQPAGGDAPRPNH